MNQAFLVWAAVTHDPDYIKMEGLDLMVSETKHRKELVAGGLDEFITAGVRDDSLWRGITNVSSEYCSLAKSLADRLGGNDIHNFWLMYCSSLSRRYQALGPMHFLRVPLEELPQVCPSSILRSRTSCLSRSFSRFRRSRSRRLYLSPLLPSIYCDSH